MLIIMRNTFSPRLSTKGTKEQHATPDGVETALLGLGSINMPSLPGLGEEKTDMMWQPISDYCSLLTREHR